MTMKTQAIVFTEPYHVDLITVAVPDPGPKEVAVRTVYSGISPGTERWTLLGRYNHYEDAVSEHYPLIPGYQRSGIVEAVGSEIQGLAVGDRVMSRGARIEDQELQAKGWLGHCGYVVIPEESLWKLGPTTDMEEASFWQMPGTGLHGVRLIGVQPNELVVVIGQGLIGQMSAQIARLRGATVITTDLIQKRVDLSALHSADIAVKMDGEELLELVRQYQPEGADVVIDTAGISAKFDFFVEMIRREGRICLQGYYPDPFHFEFHPTHEKRTTVAFPCSRDDPAKVVSLLNSHKLRIKPLITHRFPARKAKEAYELILNQAEDALGIVIEWE